jgi:putative ABC transport system permease protein
MILFKIAFRNIFRHKRRSLLTGMMMAGGCFLFAISLGIADGSYDEIIGKFTLASTGHVQIHAKGYRDKPTLYKRIMNPEATAGAALDDIEQVIAWSPRVFGPALAFAGTKTTGVRITGVDPTRESEVTSIRLSVGEGNFINTTSDNGIVISSGMARVLKIALGEEVALISQSADGSIANDLFTVRGIQKDLGSSFGQGTVLMHIDTAREFLSLYGSAHEIVVALSSHHEARKAAVNINKVLDDAIEAAPWQVVEAQFYQAMLADKKGNVVSFIIFTIIISLGVLNTILMVVLERTREFGVMRAIGTKPSQVFMLIMLESLSLATLSIAVGTVLGILANYWLSIYGIALPTPIEYGGINFERITAIVSFKTVVVPGIVIAVSSMLVSIWPAARAAHITPARAMRSI